MSGDSEEKTLDPSDHKLRKAREKGQVSSSSDFVSGLSVTVGICYLVFAWPTMSATASRLLDLSTFSILNSSPERGLAVFLTMVFEIGYIVAPFVAAIVVTGILANILDKQGVPFSTEPIKPDFNKINPGAGLKKLFSRRNATEFGVSLVKIVIWFAISGVFIWLLLPPVLASSFCSVGCVMDSALQLGILILVAAVILLAATGLLDLPMQKFLFHHEQKMGHKEMKQEQKDTMGSPEFKGHRRNEHRKLVNGGGGAKGESGGGGSGDIKDGKAGITAIIRGYENAVGVYFHPVHADVPVLVARFGGSSFLKKMTEAEKSGIPIEYDQALMGDMLKSVDLGNFIRERHFEKVAKILIRTGAIGG
ncbi:MAG: EscU/YscU/HrcU family type III secretion system export apparatus switch protein [Pseudomonadota bacterium]